MSTDNKSAEYKSIEYWLFITVNYVYTHWSFEKSGVNYFVWFLKNLHIWKYVWSRYRLVFFTWKGWSLSDILN